MRILILLVVLLCPFAAEALDAPAGQTIVDASKVLRGRFIQEHQMGNTQKPMISIGFFVIAPAQGLIWNIQRPLNTTTVVTPNAAVQMLASMTIKLPANNLRHLYDMVGGALAGDWQALDNDFTITETGSADHWTRTLKPRSNGRSGLAYTDIIITGGHFVETITLNKADTGYDKFTFADETLAAAPPSPQEIAFFNRVPH